MEKKSLDGLKFMFEVTGKKVNLKLIEIIQLRNWKLKRRKGGREKKWAVWQPVGHYQM